MVSLRYEHKPAPCSVCNRKVRITYWLDGRDMCKSCHKKAYAEKRGWFAVKNAVSRVFQKSFPASAH